MGFLALAPWLGNTPSTRMPRPEAHDGTERAPEATGLKRRIAVALSHWRMAVELPPGETGT
jgi:hypothetical protein